MRSHAWLTWRHAASWQWKDMSWEMPIFLIFLVKLSLIRPNFPKVIKSLVSVIPKDTFPFTRAREPMGLIWSEKWDPEYHPKACARCVQWQAVLLPPLYQVPPQGSIPRWPLFMALATLRLALHLTAPSYRLHGSDHRPEPMDLWLVLFSMFPRRT